MPSNKKQRFVEDLAQKLSTSKSTVIVDYSGMNVKTQQELKKRLKEVGAVMLVAKNTLFNLAAKKAGLPKESNTDEVLQGQNAIVLGQDDPIAPLQTLDKFSSEFEVPKLKIGVVEGVFQSKDTLVKLSKLPSKAGLQAQVVGYISAPLYGLSYTLQANMQNLLSILDQATKKDQQNQV